MLRTCRNYRGQRPCDWRRTLERIENREPWEQMKRMRKQLQKEEKKKKWGSKKFSSRTWDRRRIMLSPTVAAQDHILVWLSNKQSVMYSILIKWWGGGGSENEKKKKKRKKSETFTEQTPSIAAETGLSLWLLQGLLLCLSRNYAKHCLCSTTLIKDIFNDYEWLEDQVSIQHNW